MLTYVQVKDGKAVNRTMFEEPMPADWPEYETWHQNDVAQIGWSFDGTVFSPPPKPPSFDDSSIMGPTIRETITKPGV